MAGRFFQSSPSPSAMIVTNTPAADLALTNLAYCCSSDLHHFAVPGTKLSSPPSAIPSSSPNSSRIYPPCHIALNAIQRRYARASTGNSISVCRFVPPENFDLAFPTLELEFVKRGAKNEQVDAVLRANQLLKMLTNRYSILLSGQFQFA
ncbi:vesicle-fusing ATPase-like [Eucalyptus grandis]|uniref:vesicle-fusing ATPase-like n=1 Tax=Eucalyptus grandis TaxID=71139 RepID=UPI00192EBE82|nr:vesicle-fusing ATPase-like [Eucalyptus grandis]